MRKNIRLRHEAHIRANNVCAEHSATFDATSGGRRTRERLGGCVTTVDHQLAVRQKAAGEVRAATSKIRVARADVHTAIKVVVKIGKLAKLDDATLRTLRRPFSISDEELLAHCRALDEILVTHSDEFYEEGLPSDIPSNLAGAARRVAAARDARAQAYQRSAAALQTILETQETADKAIAALEAVADNTPAAHPEVVTKLRVAMRVGPRATEPPVKPEAPPSPSSTTPGQAA